MLIKMLTYFGVFFLLVCEGLGMSLKGRALTQYDPCGLGVVYFDKVTDLLWRGTVNLGLYPHIVDAQIEINFKDPIVYYGVSQQSKVIVNKRLNEFIFVPKGRLPPLYNIYFSVNSTAPVAQPTVTKFTLNNILLCDKQKNTTSEAGVTGQCGRRSPDHSELVSVRAAAAAGDWPWHAAVLVRGQETERRVAMYQCGGNVLSRTAVLTAGHCMFIGNRTIDTERLVVVAGISNLWDEKEIGRQVVSVEQVVLHPAYVLEQATSDLAILLVESLAFTEYVQPICLWGPLYDKTRLYGQRAVIAGFGLTENNVMSNSLRASYTVVQPDDICKISAPALYSGLLNEFTFCASEGPNSGTSPLNGDSGGGLAAPFVQNDNKITWILIGVLSKCVIPGGKKTCDPQYHSVYTDVAAHYGWIYHHIAH